MIVAPKAPASIAPPNAALKAAAQRFEAVFVRQMMAAMRKGQLGDDIFGSSATDSFREMADANTADAIAQHGALGIAALVERQFGGAR